MSGTPSPAGRRRGSVGLVPMERRACDMPRSQKGMLASNLTTEERHGLLSWVGGTTLPAAFTKDDEARAQAILKEEREKLRKTLELKCAALPCLRRITQPPRSPCSPLSVATRAQDTSKRAAHRTAEAKRPHRV